MNLNDITTKPYILALFKRDDGTRFLLGSGAYEFKEDQTHFVANVMANDVVEVQGSDGALLAGQVRRAATQSFNGFIADASSTKGSVENYRKAFIAFFQKNHYYTVVYIFADGTAIQRRRGYIVDSPEVKELWQMTPEYHVALNFEDVNYYKYAENADGDEIYSNLANLTSKITASGGLIWDSIGSATTTAEGTNFTIFGTTAEDNLESVQIKGQTTQASYSGKNYVYTTAGTFTGIKFEYNSTTGETTVSGTPQYTYAIATAITLPTALPAGTYTVSIQEAQDIIVGVGTYNASNTRTARPIVVGGTSYTFTTTDTITKVDTYISGLTANTSIGTKVLKVQLEAGSPATDFEPYVGGIASPNPDYPQTVQTVTGTQTITISDGDSQSQTLSVRLGSVELCKIGNSQDYIYKNNGNWYIHKEIGKENMSTLSGLSVISTGNFIASGFASNYGAVIGEILSNIFIYSTTSWEKVGKFGIAPSGNLWAMTGDSTITTSNISTWLSNKNAVVYYALATPTDTQITDADLISDLNDLLGADTYEGNTSFASSATVGLPAWLVVEAKTGSGGVIWDNIGATWEVGGEAGDTILTVDSITNVFPTITITGPAHNPQITNVTTGQILKYTGNITSSQKLVIDVQQKTAKLNGTSVISNVSGDWLYLMPGNNRMVYTIDNAEPNTAIIEWQEITG